MVMTFENLSKLPGLTQFVTTRDEGTMDVRTDETAEGNRMALAESIGIRPDAFIWCEQVHDNKAALVGTKEAGAGAAVHVTAIPGVDALVTQDEGVCLAVMVADCLPVLIHDPKTRTIAACHAGRKGLLKDIIPRTLRLMSERCDVAAADLLVGIGPAICKDHYAVTTSLLPKEVAAGQYVSEEDGETRLDLQGLATSQLIGAGVSADNIEVMPPCTSERTDMFFSARAEGETGRFAAGIMLASGGA